MLYCREGFLKLLYAGSTVNTWPVKKILLGKTEQKKAQKRPKEHQKVVGAKRLMSIVLAGLKSSSVPGNKWSAPFRTTLSSTV
jgi:hypothetical protein